MLVRSLENKQLVFPKGTIKKKETMYEAACRELFEETGTSIVGNLEDPLCVYTYIRNKKLRNVVVYPAFVVDLGVAYPEYDKREKKWNEVWRWKAGTQANPRAYARTTKKLLKMFMKGNK